MTKARRECLKEAWVWFDEQGFTEDSHIVKAYRTWFSVDKDWAMRELCLLGVLSPEKQKSYQDQLRAKEQKRAEKKAAKSAKSMQPALDTLVQDENFFFIAGYTPGGAQYGITREEEEGLEAAELEPENLELHTERFDQCFF